MHTSLNRPHIRMGGLITRFIDSPHVHYFHNNFREFETKNGFKNKFPDLKCISSGNSLCRGCFAGGEGFRAVSRPEQH